MKHIKPTQEELENSLKKTQEELEVATDEETPEEETKEEVVEEVAPSEEVVEEEKKEEVKPSEPPSPDYKEKFSESSKEAQKIHAKNRTINEGVAKASEIKDVDEEELKAEYPDWDIMSETERKLAKKNLINDKRFEIVTKATEEAKKIEKWGEDVDKFIESPATLADNPELDGKEEEFKAFANEPANHAIPFKILVSAFIHDMSTKVKPKSKGKMFETGSGGPNDKIKTKGDKISIDEAAKLMRTDYKKYKQYLVSGKIDNTIE